MFLIALSAQPNCPGFNKNVKVALVCSALVLLFFFFSEKYSKTFFKLLSLSYRKSL